MDVYLMLISFSVCFLLGSSEFLVERNKDGFNISLVREEGDILIVQHTTDVPFLYIGKGRTDFRVNEGNAHIDQYIDFKEPLRQFSVENVNEDFLITLHGYGTIKVQIRLTSTVEHQLALEFVSFPEEIYNCVWLRLVAIEQEHLYGAGEQFTHFDLNGHKFQIWTREQGIGRNISSPLTYLAEHYGGGYGGNYDHTYFPQPTFTSSRKYYCHVHGYSFTELDFEQEDFHEIHILGKPSALYFNSAATMKGVLHKLTSFLKRQPVLPAWLRKGVIIGMQGGTETLLNNLATAESSGVSVAGLWIQDWAGSIYTAFGKRVFWNWEWNEQTYPGLDVEIKKLSEKGVKLLAYITAHLNTKGNLYQKNKDNDYFMKNSDGDIYLINFGEFLCATVDLTNEEAWSWYKGVITTNLIEFGFGGWMADFGEYIPVDAVFSNGETGKTMHNKFSVLWAKLNRQAVEESGKLGEIMFFMRAGGTGSQEFSVMSWAGDQSVDFTYSDGLPSTIPAALSLGMSGFGLTHFDIGGYTSVIRNGSDRGIMFDVKVLRDEELFLRGAEMAVFTPVMRTHEGNIPPYNFQVFKHPVTMKKMAVLVNMFKALGKYTHYLMEENTNTGLPLQRPLFLHYDSDCQSYGVEYQYMYGEDLLVAPVVESGRQSWDVYLPPDTWVHLFTGNKYQGTGTVTVEAPIGKPPVFYREGTKWQSVFTKVAEIANNSDQNVKSEL